MSHVNHRPLSSVLALLLAGTFPVLGGNLADAPEVGEAGTRDARADGYHSVDDQLRMLLELLFEDSPLIERAELRAAAQSERAAQVAALPDPRLSYRYFVGQPETRVGPQRQSLEISQALPGFGQRELDREYAEIVGDAWDSHLAHDEREQAAKLKRAYFEAAYLQEALAINEVEQDLLGRFEAVALKRYATGSGIQQSAIKIQTELTRVADRRLELGSQLAARHHQIARLVSRPVYAIPLRPIELAPPAVEMRPDELERLALRNNPRVRAAAAQNDAASNRLRRSDAAGHPDFSVSLGYTDVGRRDDAAAQMGSIEDDGKDIWSIGATVSLPLHRAKLRAGIAEAGHRLEADRQELRITSDHVLHALQDSLLRFASLRDRLALYDEVLIPQAQESLGSAEAAYATNRMDVLALLDAQRVLLQSRLTYYRLLADSWISLTDIEELIAIPYPPTTEEDRS